MPDRNDPLSHWVDETPEEVEAFWREQEPIRAAQQAAANELIPAIIGLPVDQARRRVAQEADRAGVSLTLRAVASGTPVTAMFGHGRITATVRDGIIETADPG